MDMVKSKRVPYGRGYRWILLFCLYCVMVIYPGVFFSQAPLFVTIMHRFDVTRTEASIVPSLMLGLGTGLGGLVGPLMHRFGKRTLMLLGSLLASSAMVASAFATSLTYLIVTSGIMVGTGICPVILGSQTAVGELFQGKHRAIILSFINTGNGVGGAIFPQFAEYIDNKYGFLGIHILLGGLFLQGVVASMLILPERTATRRKRPDSIVRKNIMANNDTSLGNTNNAFDHTSDQASQSAYFIHVTSEHKGLNEQENVVFMKNAFETSTHNYVPVAKKSTVCKNEETENEIPPVDNMHVQDSLHALSVQANVASCHNNPPQVHVQRNTDCQMNGGTDTQTGAHCKTTPRNIRFQELDKEVQTYTNPSVIESLRFLSRQKLFWLYAAGLALVFPTLTVLPIFIIDLCTDIGLSRSEGTLALSLINTSSVLGRFLPGLFLKIPKMPALGIPIISGTFQAISLCVIATSTTATQIHVFSTAFGLSHGVCISTFSVVTVELFGVNHMANGIGLLYSTSAISGIAFGPIGGYIRDTTQQYSIVLFVAAGMCMLGTVMFVVGEIVRRKADRKSNNKFQTVFVTKL